MRGVTISIVTGRNDKSNTPALFSAQRILINALSDQISPRFRFVGAPHNAPPPLC